jgi:cytochrome c oxidase subunit II
MFSIITFIAFAIIGRTGIVHTGAAQAASANTIEIHARRFNFSPAEITLKKGETVTLKLYSDDVPHSLVIKDLGVNREVSKSHPEEVSVTPQQTGDFHGKCGRFCGSGHGSMSFTVHVQE